MCLIMVSSNSAQSLSLLLVSCSTLVGPLSATAAPVDFGSSMEHDFCGETPKCHQRLVCRRDAEVLPSEVRPPVSSRQRRRPNPQTRRKKTLDGLDRFLDPEYLPIVIDSHGGEREFSKFVLPLANNSTFVHHLNLLPSDKRMSIVNRMAAVLRWDESTMALPIERSDVDSDERRQRMSNNAPGGKTGAFVHIFRRLLTWVNGGVDLQEMAEKEMKDRLLKTEEALARGEDPATLDQHIMKQLNDIKLSEKKELPGALFIPGKSDDDVPPESG